LVGWTFVPFTIIILFCLLFRRPPGATPSSGACSSWAGSTRGLVQPALSGTLTMGPLIALGARQGRHRPREAAAAAGVSAGVSRDGRPPRGKRLSVTPC
jgi:hypothetical protein